MADRETVTRLARALMREVDESYFLEWKLSDFAESHFVDASYLSTVFARTAGLPFSAFLMQTRLRQGERFLHYTGLSIPAIAEMVGLHDRAYFTRVFTRQYGIPPAQYRKQAQIRSDAAEEYVYIAVFKNDAMIAAQDMEGLVRFADEKRVHAVIESSPQLDMASTLGIFDRVIRRKPAGIMVCAYNRAFIPLMERARELGIPVVTVDGNVETDAKLCTVQSNWFEIGRNLGEKLAEKLQSGDAVAVFVMGIDELSTKDGLDGVRAAFVQSGLVLAMVEDDNTDVAKAKCLTEGILLRHPEIKGFIGLDCNSSLGICQALEINGRRDIAVTAVDNAPQQLRWLKRGYIHALAGQNRALFAYYGGLVLYNAVHSPQRDSRGRAMSPTRIDTGLCVVTADRPGESIP